MILAAQSLCDLLFAFFATRRYARLAVMDLVQVQVLNKRS